MPAEGGRLIADEAAMRAFGARLIEACDRGGVITLRGDLGSGKTTLVRGALEARGVTTGVRSPTYTLVEYYPLQNLALAHFDLYRLADAEELEYLGFRDYLDAQTLCFIEWPERAAGYLHDIDLEIRLEYAAGGRSLSLHPASDWGHELAARLNWPG